MRQRLTGYDHKILAPMNSRRHPASGVASVILIALILFLTLTPNPLPDKTPPMFPGADKLAHAAMFGALALSLLFDYRLINRRLPSVRTAVATTAAASVFGGLIEILQQAMGMGRTAEWGDFVADTAGAFGALTLFLIILRFRRN